MFLPNSHSFLLARSVISKPVIQSGIQESVPTSASEPSSSACPEPSRGDSGKPTIVNKDKRTFLKVAGIAGVSLAGSLLLPKKASALIMGSSPTTGVVGVKNSTNARINPATEETVSSLLKPTDLDFDGSGYLNVNIQANSDSSSSSFSDSGGVSRRGLVDATTRNVQVDVISSALPAAASTETTLTTISWGGVKFALKMTTVGSVDYIAEAPVGTAFGTAAWRVKKVDSSTGIVITWADGNANPDNVATDLTALTYS